MLNKLTGTNDMTRIFFAGHNNFGNRGCEALVRSVSGLIRQRYPDARFVTPSVAPELDASQWKDAASKGIDFVPAASYPAYLRWWNRARRVLPPLEKLSRPSHRLPAALEAEMANSDMVVMTGGDNISLDYDLGSLYDIVGYIDNAKRLGKPAVLWGASVGPFSRKPHVEAFMRQHLADYAAITVRETETAKYLRGIGIENVIEVTDPAFTMLPEPFVIDEILPEAPEGLVGINVSPLVRNFRVNEASRTQLDHDVATFVRELAERGYGVVLLPHVGPLDGNSWNSDYHYLAGLMQKYGLDHPRIRLAPATLNAAQLKYLISQFRFFIGARTHATIAAFSTGVPTLSIAYSIKAKGINRDLFGDTRLVLDTPAVGLDTLRQGVKQLHAEEADIRALLAERIPLWKQRAALPVDALASILGAR